MLFQSVTIFGEAETSKPIEKIFLEKATKTRSVTATEVNTYTDDNILTVEVENYTGDVYVQVFGAEGATQLVFSSYNYGSAILDISSLPQGTYTVSITLNSTYQGIFVK